jgi:hypothetical protein
MNYAMSELTPGPTDDAAMLRQRVENLERVVATILRTPNVQTGPAHPSAQPGANARDGTLYGQTGNTLWMRIGSAWRGVSLPLT